MSLLRKKFDPNQYEDPGITGAWLEHAHSALFTSTQRSHLMPLISTSFFYPLYFSALPKETFWTGQTQGGSTYTRRKLKGS